MNYFVIGDEDTVLGFGLAGIEGQEVTTSDEAAQALDTALQNAAIRIVIITERIADLIRPRVDSLIFSEQFPLIVEIPDRNGKLSGKPGLREMVNRAIGISV